MTESTIIEYKKPVSVKPNDRIADSCENCGERGRICVFSAECLLHGGAGGKRRVCDDHLKRKNVIACLDCGSKSHFVEMKNRHQELTGIGYYYCTTKECGWTSGEDLIPPKGLDTEAGE